MMLIGISGVAAGKDAAVVQQTDRWLAEGILSLGCWHHDSDSERERERERELY